MDRAFRARQQWQAEFPDAAFGPMEIFDRLNEAVLVFRRDWLEPLLARHGLQPGEFDVLAALLRSGAPYA
ncbi:hypothetical protein PSA7680_02057 [Pseudoruegeria aquimaris]|uniref:Uncharacterized protein n=1 Tax=Pseudoruegeria aquimaris TaxID=393663 RepID=A0A1Y5SI30_9RHOB|nr:hypothetical protein [Pseudoruegeria aquimaris]SLN41348.1 hypothetical protein PSA7680_02057 [Pseudoruegeria aquimaris]